MKYICVLQLFLMVYSFFGLFSKMASQEDFLSWKFIIYYAVVICNLGIYAIVWQQILKRISLVEAYANKAVIIIWGILWGKIFFQEQITYNKIVGALIIICGIILVVSDKEESCE